MSIFKILKGERISTSEITSRLSNYNKKERLLVEGMTKTIEIIENVENFQVKRNGTIMFDFFWDSKEKVIHRGSVDYIIRTNKHHVRVLLGNPTFFLIEKGKFRVERRISELLYGNPYIIKIAVMSPDIIKEIQDDDMRHKRMGWFKNISDRDRVAAIFGDLADNEDGQTSESPMEAQLKNAQYYATGFRSISTSRHIRISGKKNTVSMSPGDYDELEDYIKKMVIRRFSN